MAGQTVDRTKEHRALPSSPLGRAVLGGILIGFLLLATIYSVSVPIFDFYSSV